MIFLLCLKDALLDEEGIVLNYGSINSGNGIYRDGYLGYFPLN
jgi:hypothetical protein